MPRCNLTLKQKAQLIELSEVLSTGELAKKFRVHTTTVTRTIKKKDRILCQASRVNPNFKTVQTNLKSEEHDTMVLDYIRSKQGTNIPISVSDICDKAVECAKSLGREIKSRRAWWRRFRIRCNVVRIRVGSQGNQKASDDEGTQEEKDEIDELSPDQGSSPKKVITLPTINLPDQSSELADDTQEKNKEDEDHMKCGDVQASDLNKDLTQTCGTGNDRNVEEACSMGGEDRPPVVSPLRASPLKRKKPKKTGKVAKKDKKKAKKSSVINFTFKIKKENKRTPSKSTSVK